MCAAVKKAKKKMFRDTTHSPVQRVHVNPLHVYAEIKLAITIFLIGILSDPQRKIVYDERQK